MNKTSDEIVGTLVDEDFEMNNVPDVVWIRYSLVCRLETSIRFYNPGLEFGA